MIKHDYKCGCGKPAVRQTQEVIEDYTISNDGEFELAETDPIDDSVTFYCQKCYDEQYS
jgi:hypothetical protein